MTTCPYCAEEIQAAAVVCKHCHSGIVRSPSGALVHATNRVSVVDINMPFGSMVGFMVKWSIATIPALLLLGFIIGGIVLGVMAVSGGLTGASSPTRSVSFSPADDFRPTELVMRNALRLQELPCAEGTGIRLERSALTTQQSVWDVDCSAGNRYRATFTSVGVLDKIQKR